MRPSRGPTIVSVPIHSASANNGVSCCCCQCCSCVNFNFLRTEPGMIKLAEVVFGFFCQSLALNYGWQYSSSLGPSFQSFLTGTSWCMSTTLLLLICYVFSSKSVNLIKSSVFETLFNTIAAFTYISSCSYLGYAVNVILQPLYMSTPYGHVFQAMSAAYMVGTILGLLHAYDAYKSYKYFKGYRY